MISKEKLNRCLNILSELNARIPIQYDKNLILEMGYIIKEELNQIELENKLDIKKLWQDNVALAKDNDTLHKTVQHLTSIINEKIPSINETLNTLISNSSHLQACIQSL